MKTLTRSTALAALIGLALPVLAQKVPPPASAPSNLPPGANVAVPLLNRARLDVNARQAVIAEDFVFKATLTLERPSPLLAGRAVKFTLNGAAACTGTTDGAGVASCHFTIPPMAQGFFDYKAEFKGGDGLSSAKAEAKFLVGKAQTKLQIVLGGLGDVPLVPGETVQIGAGLTRALDGSRLDGKPIVFSANGSPIGTETSVLGTAWRAWKVPAGATGPQKLEVFFVTDDSYVGTSATLTKNVSRKAFLKVLNEPVGVVGKTITVKGQVAKVPPIIGVVVPNTGLAGRKVMFIFDGHDPTTNTTGPHWNWTATTDGNGIATVSKPAEWNASKVRLRLEPPTDGWDADEVTDGCNVVTSPTKVTAPPLSGRIGTNATLKVHVSRQTDGAARKFARVHVTKFDSSSFPNPVEFSTDANGDGKASIEIKSQMGIGNHTLTVIVDGDGMCRPATITIPLTVQPSA